MTSLFMAGLRLLLGAVAAGQRAAELGGSCLHSARGCAACRGSSARHSCARLLRLCASARRRRLQPKIAMMQFDPEPGKLNMTKAGQGPACCACALAAKAVSL